MRTALSTAADLFVVVTYDESNRPGAVTLTTSPVEADNPSEVVFRVPAMTSHGEPYGSIDEGPHAARNYTETRKLTAHLVLRDLDAHTTPVAPGLHAASVLVGRTHYAFGRDVLGQWGWSSRNAIEDATGEWTAGDFGDFDVPVTATVAEIVEEITQFISTLSPVTGQPA